MHPRRGNSPPLARGCLGHPHPGRRRTCPAPRWSAAGTSISCGRRARSVGGRSAPRAPDPPSPGVRMSASPPHDPTPAGPSIAVVGAGPTAIGLLERLIASAPELGGAGRLQVHLIDPHPPGGGRVWRAAQPSLLWANSLAADVTVLPDPSVTVDGPVGEGTTLWQWVEAVGRHLPDGDPVGAEARGLSPTSFPSRPLVNAYLGWALASVVEAARPWADVHLHRTRALDVHTREDGARVILAGGEV